MDFDFIFSSLKNSLKELYNFDYKPTTWIADGAEAITNGFKKAFGYNSVDEFTRIMCWAHVVKAVEKRLNGIDETFSDILNLQKSHCPELFDHLVKLFFEKWNEKKKPDIDKFLSYFKSEWIDSTNKKWYEGAALNIPSTDKGLESINGKIKLIYTLRQRMSVNEYLNNAVFMLRNMSKERVDDKKFCETIEITDDAWVTAYSFIHNNNIVQRKANTEEFLVVYTKHSELLKSKDFLINKFAKLKLNFDDLVGFMVRLNKVILNRSKWTESTCTCNEFLKNYFCFHIMVVAANEKLLVIPNKYKKIQIAMKKKSGRKPKAKKALEKQ